MNYCWRWLECVREMCIKIEMPRISITNLYRIVTPPFAVTGTDTYAIHVTYTPGVCSRLAGGLGWTNIAVSFSHHTRHTTCNS